DLTDLRSRDEPELLVTCTKSRDEHRHVSISLHASKALHCLQHTRRDPPQHHLSVAPAFDITLHVTRATDETLGGVRRRERAAQAGREFQREHGERLVEAFAHALGGAWILGL